jgi:hypothetical protein
VQERQQKRKYEEDTREIISKLEKRIKNLEHDFRRLSKQKRLKVSGTSDFLSINEAIPAPPSIPASVPKVIENPPQKKETEVVAAEPVFLAPAPPPPPPPPIALPKPPAFLKKV